MLVSGASREGDGVMAADETDGLHDELAGRLGDMASAPAVQGSAVPSPAASNSASDTYRVERTLKESPVERTELVWFRGLGGGELGPFVRKRISADSGLGAAYRQLWAAERAGRRFSHLPHVVSCADDERGLTVLLDWVPGPTLLELVLTASAERRVELAARLVPAVCDAASELHEAFVPPVIHRDLTPGNVVLPEGDPTSPVLIDLGISRSWSEGARADTTHFGTRAYAPPEQFGFGQTDVRSDVYALGMLALFCLVGRDPVPDDRERGFAVAGVPEAWRLVIARACDLDPSKRYGSARELGQAFLGAAGALSFSGVPDASGVSAGSSAPDVAGVSAASGTTSFSATTNVPAAVSAPSVPPAPPAAQVSNAERGVLGAIGRFGIRNGLVALVSVGLSLMSVGMATDRSNYLLDYPVVYEGFIYAVTIPVLFLAVGWGLLDKLRLALVAPRLAGHGRARNLRLVLLVLLADFLAVLAVYVATGAQG